MRGWKASESGCNKSWKRQKAEEKKGKERKVTRRKGNVFAQLPRDDDRERSFVTFYCLLVNAFQRQRFLLDQVPSYEIFDGDDGERVSVDKRTLCHDNWNVKRPFVGRNRPGMPVRANNARLCSLPCIFVRSFSSLLHKVRIRASQTSGEKVRGHRRSNLTGSLDSRLVYTQPEFQC